MVRAANHADTLRSPRKYKIASGTATGTRVAREIRTDGTNSPLYAVSSGNRGRGSHQSPRLYTLGQLRHEGDRIVPNTRDPNYSETRQIQCLRKVRDIGRIIAKPRCFLRRIRQTVVLAVS